MGNDKSKEEMAEIANKIGELAAKYFKIDKYEIYGESINHNVSLARHIAWYVLHADMGIPTSILAKEFLRSRRHIFFGINKIRQGMKMQRFYSDLHDSFMSFVKDGCKI